jgi:hypothetical protein
LGILIDCHVFSTLKENVQQKFVIHNLFMLSEKRGNLPPELSKFSKQWKVEVAFKI